jgi:hypothetical protein
LQKEFSAKNYISIRNEFLDHMRGQRTGFKAFDSEPTIMWGLWISGVMMMRPERASVALA